jgi:hypothetical protein
LSDGENIERREVWIELEDKEVVMVKSKRGKRNRN